MRLVEYFVGPFIYLWSPLMLEECRQRVNAASGSVLNPFHLGVTGFIWLSQVRLRYRSALHEFGTKPVLVGRIDPMHGGTRFQLRFRAPMPAYFALALAFPMLLMMIWLAMLASNSLGVSTDDAAPLLMAAIVFVVLPFAMFFVGARNADAQLDALMRFLAQHVQARPLAEHLRPDMPGW